MSVFHTAWCFHSLFPAGLYRREGWVGRRVRLCYTCSLTHSVVVLCSGTDSLVGPSRAVAVCTSFVFLLLFLLLLLFFFLISSCTSFFSSFQFSSHISFYFSTFHLILLRNFPRPFSSSLRYFSSFSILHFPSTAFTIFTGSHNSLSLLQSATCTHPLVQEIWD